jgi:glutathione S-transferase
MILCLGRCELSLASGDFLVNGDFSLADIAMIPFIDRIAKLRPEILESGKYPRVMSWYDRMKSWSAFDRAFNYADTQIRQLRCRAQVIEVFALLAGTQGPEPWTR